MTKYTLLVDSSCNKEERFLQDNSIDYLTLSYCIDEQEYTVYGKDKLEFDEFYTRLKIASKTSTSCINSEIYYEKYSELLKKGKDVLYVCLSSGLSSTYNNAVFAAERINAEKHNNKVYVIDTLCGGSGLGILVDIAMKMRDDGKTVTETLDVLEKDKWKIQHWFFVEDLLFLKKGGRIGSATAVIGSLLKIHPVVTTDKAGKLVNVEKAIGRKKSIMVLLNKLTNNIDSAITQKIYIGHANCESDAIALKEMILSLYKNASVEIACIDNMLACHCGPKCLAIFFKS